MRRRLVLILAAVLLPAALWIAQTNTEMAIIPAGSLVVNAPGEFLFHSPAGALLALEYISDGDVRGGLITLDSGPYFQTSGTGGELKVLTSQLALVGGQTLGDAKGAATNYVGTFYTIDGSTIKKINPLTGLTLQSWTIGAGFDAIGVAPDDSVAYIGNNNDDHLSVYDLVASSGPTTWTTETTCGFAFGGALLFAMRNGEVIAGWMDNAFSPAHPFVAHYDASGTQLHRYNVGLEAGAQDFIVALSPALDDLSIWAAVYLQTPGVVRYSQIQISDGAILNTFDVVPITDGGAHNYDNANFAVVQVQIGGYVPVAPPLAAQQPCAPQALVGNGGKGAAGCNVGGIGGGQQYAGALGNVPQHTDPPAGETLTGKEGQGIEAWIELVHTDYPSGVKTTYRRAFEELADTDEGGRKPAGVLAIGDVENALGHEQGGFEAATADIALSDIRDRLIRELSEDQELEGDEVYVKLRSDPGRVAQVTPRVLFRGIVQKPELASGLHARLTVVDALFSDFGPFGPDRKDPNWTFGDLGSSAPQMTSDTKAQVIPRLYGEKSDEGAVDPITGDPAAKGLMPGFYLGRFDLTGLVAQAPPSLGQSLAAVVAQLQASHTAGTLVADFGAIIGTGDAGVLQAMGSVPTSYTSLAQVIGYGDLDVLLSMGTTTAPPPSDWGFIATGLGPWFLYTGVHGSDLGQGNATMQHDRIQLDAANRADLLVPGVNWPFADPYFTFTNDDGRVFWITGVFVMGPLLQDHLDGVVTMAFNAIGTEDVGDGTGLPIMRAEDCKQHWLENHCFDQWSSGPYTTTGTFPQWEDGTPKVNTSSFLARQNFFKAQIGGEGLLFSWYTDTQQPTLETVRQLNASSESRLGVNKDGQMVDWGLDETIDYTLWPRVNHVIDVFDQVTRTSGEERQNVVNGSCDWDADFEKFRLGPFTFSSAMGLAKYKGRRKAGDPVDSTMLGIEAQLLWVLERRLARLQIGTTVLQASGSMGWLDRDVGDGILFTSEDGPGPNGYVDHPFVIVRRKTRLTTMLVQYTLWDVLPVITATLGSPGTP